MVFLYAVIENNPNRKEPTMKLSILLLAATICVCGCEHSSIDTERMSDRDWVTGLVTDTGGGVDVGTAAEGYGHITFPATSLMADDAGHFATADPEASATYR